MRHYVCLSLVCLFGFIFNAPEEIIHYLIFQYLPVLLAFLISAKICTIWLPLPVVN